MFVSLAFSRRIAALGSVALLACASFLRASEFTAAPPLGIGLLLPNAENEAESLRQGATLAIEHANALPGEKARLLIRGRTGQWGTEGNEAAALALDDGALALITPPSAIAAHEVLQVSGRTQIPVASLCPDTSITGAMVPWAVQIVPDNRHEAEALLSSIESTAGSSLRWAAIVLADRAGREPARDLRSAARATASNLADPIALPNQAPDRCQIKETIDRVLASRPDAVLLWTDPHTGGQLARALRQAGFMGRLAGCGRLCSQDFLESAGEAAAGLVFPKIASQSDAPANCRFDAAYRARFSSGPDDLALMAYDATLLLVRITREFSPELAYRAFPLQKGYSGASGDLQFDRSGARLVDLRLMVYEDGQFKPFSRRRLLE